MQKIKILILIMTLSFPLISQAQTKAKADFISFINHQIKIPDDIKYNCKWTYSVVIAETDSHNIVTRYEFINDVSSSLKESFNQLTGYHFPLPRKTISRSFIFYFSVDNRDICKAKPDDFVYLFPNDVLLQVTSALAKARKDYPKAIVISAPVIKMLYEVQH